MGQVALCGLFSDTVKRASMSLYQHLQGELNPIKKLDRHYYGLFGFMAVKMLTYLLTVLQLIEN